MTAVHSIVLALVLAATAAGLGACNTIEGFGKDLQAAGDAIAGTADEEDEDEE